MKASRNGCWVNAVGLMYVPDLSPLSLCCMIRCEPLVYVNLALNTYSHDVTCYYSNSAGAGKSRRTSRAPLESSSSRRKCVYLHIKNMRAIEIKDIGEITEKADV